MFRYATLALTAAALAACATTSKDTQDMTDANPNATTVEVMAPEPVVAAASTGSKMADKMAGKNTDVMGNSLMTSEEADALEAKAAEMMSEEAAAPKFENLYYTAQTKWEMMKFIEAVNAAELATALEADGAMTIFAPTTEAFDRAGDTAATADLLKGHIVSGTLLAEDLMARAANGESSLATLAGTELTVYVMGDEVKIADPSGRLYTVTQADNKASNGVLHMINGVLAGE